MEGGTAAGYQEAKRSHFQLQHKAESELEVRESSKPSWEALLARKNRQHQCSFFTKPLLYLPPTNVLLLFLNVISMFVMV